MVFANSIMVICGEAETKIQKTKMLVTCQRFGDLFLFGLVWQYILQFRQNIIKVGSNSWQQ